MNLSLYTDKIHKIRQAATVVSPGTGPELSLHAPIKLVHHNLNMTQPLTLEEIMQHLKSSSCWFAILTTGFSH